MVDLDAGSVKRSIQQAERLRAKQYPQLPVTDAPEFRLPRKLSFRQPSDH
jgi:hypothetical protein